MASLSTLPPELLLSIMNYGFWAFDDPDYQSAMSWSLVCKSLAPCAQTVLFSYVILDNVHSLRSLLYAITEQSTMARFLRSRVLALEVSCKDEIGVSSIYLHDFVKLLPWLPSLRYLGFDPDRFYNFAPVSLGKIRHASDSLTSVTLKPSVGWTVLQLLERLPTLTRIHLIAHGAFDHFPRGHGPLYFSSNMSFKEVACTAVANPQSLTCMVPLLRHILGMIEPEEQSRIPQGSKNPSARNDHIFDVIELLGAPPAESALEQILEVAGCRTRKLHIERFHPTKELKKHCQSGVLEELVLGIEEQIWINHPPFHPFMHQTPRERNLFPLGATVTSDPIETSEFISDTTALFTQYPRKPAQKDFSHLLPLSILNSIPPCVKRLTLFGRREHILPLDIRFPRFLTLLEGDKGSDKPDSAFPSLKELRIIVDNSPFIKDPAVVIPAFSQRFTLDKKLYNYGPLPIFSSPSNEKEWAEACKRAGVDFHVSQSKNCFPLLAPTRFSEPDVPKRAHNGASSVSFIRPTLTTRLSPL